MFVMIFIHCQHQSNTNTKMAIAFQGVFQFCHTFSAQFFRFCQNRVKTWVSKVQLPLLLLTWLLTLHSSMLPALFSVPKYSRVVAHAACMVKTSINIDSRGKKGPHSFLGSQIRNSQCFSPLIVRN